MSTLYETREQDPIIRITQNRANTLRLAEFDLVQAIESMRRTIDLDVPQIDLSKHFQSSSPQEKIVSASEPVTPEPSETLSPNTMAEKASQAAADLAEDTLSMIKKMDASHRPEHN